jgi:SSS family solute:Na+ symporter
MSNFALSSLDLAIIVASVVFSVGVGFWASHRVEKTTRGFFLASGKMPWWLIGAAFVSTSVSSEQIVGTVGAATSTAWVSRTGNGGACRPTRWS